jgi:hypothetical protein
MGDEYLRYIDASPWTLEYLWETISMPTDNSNIPRLRSLVVEWNVLLNSKFELIVLAVCGRAWVFAYMRCGERVLLYFEKRHCVVQMRPGFYQISIVCGNSRSRTAQCYFH